MSVGRICVREVDTAAVHESVYAVSQRMHQRGVGCLVVVNDASEPVGMVTDRDLVARVLAKASDPMQTKVGDVMTREPKWISEESPIESVLALMRSGGFRRLPIIDRSRKLVGLISLDDILMRLAEEFIQVGNVLQRETPRYAVTHPS
jgi:CBS domain-containing protein